MKWWYQVYEYSQRLKKINKFCDIILWPVLTFEHFPRLEYCYDHCTSFSSITLYISCTIHLRCFKVLLRNISHISRSSYNIVFPICMSFALGWKLCFYEIFGITSSLSFQSVNTFHGHENRGGGLKSLKITTFKSVYSNKAKIGS